MKTSTTIGIVAVVIAVIAVGGALSFAGYRAAPLIPPLPSLPSAGYEDATYAVDGRPITLKDGRAEIAAAPGSASMDVFSVSGGVATGDLNGDGADDVVFILTEDAGGSGTFYYVAVALKTADGYQGMAAIPLGDRIAPQKLSIASGELTVAWLTRPADAPMSQAPTVPMSMDLKLNGKTFVTVVGAGERCGGNMTTAPMCAAGYHCAPVPGSHLPFGDVGGACVAN